MKKLLLLPLVLFVMLVLAMVNPFSCNAQTNLDSILTEMKKEGVATKAISGTTGTLSTLINADAGKVIYDTVRVIMLIADTTYIPGSMTFTAFEGNGIKIMESKNRVPYLFWQFGFEVWVAENHTFVDRYYLSEKKKPLPKSIIIFQSIPIP